MSPILGIIDSQKSGHLYSNSFDSLSTDTVGVGGKAQIDFTSIPSTYTHLQLSINAQTNRATYGGDGLFVKVGYTSIDSGSNYSQHYYYGAGSAASGGSSYSAGYINVGPGGCVGTTAGGTFGTVILDFPLYSNTAINKTVRGLFGSDDGAGSSGGFGRVVGIQSGAWYSTSAIAYIRIQPQNGTLFNQGSSFALYGIK